MDVHDIRVIFMGSPEFADPPLRALLAAEYNVVLAVTQPDRPAGRGSRLRPPPVKVLAESYGVDVYQPESLKDPEAQEHLRDYRPDLIVVAAYGRILPRAVLDMSAHGAVNVHASLLPRWRGASPVTAAILAGDEQVGVSIMEVVPKMDAGPVIASRAVAMPDGATTGTLEPRLSELGASLLIDVLPAWYDGHLVAVPQDDEAATYCSLIRKEDGHLAASMSAAEAERAVRAYDPWPGAFVLYRGERLAIHRARVEHCEHGSRPGTLLLHGKLPAIAFCDGLLVLEEVQRGGGKRIPGDAFVNGERGKLEAAVELR